jgi:AcrR family transcriptional regulator
MLLADMTRTPWGESEQLRDRMMVTGPRVSPAEAAQNQRERLFGALVAVCAERGYEAATIREVVALSGVSRRDFYRHFADKEACFLAAMDEILGSAREIAMSRYEDSGGGLETLIKLAAAQPAAARLCLLESDAAGAAALARIEAATREAVGLYDEVLRSRGELSSMPREVGPAILGGIREVVQARLLDARESGLAELAELAPALRAWVFAYHSPPAPLPRPRSQAGAPGRYRPEDPVERILDATTALIASVGYRAMTIDAIVARAGVSLSTFYAHFAGRQEVLVAALDAGQARLVGVTLPPYRRAREWPIAVRAAFEAMFAFFVAEPDFARMAMVEVYAAGGEALARRGRMLRGLQVYLDPGFERAPGVAPIVAEAIGGATYALVGAEIRRAGVGRLPALAPLATYLTLAPFLGAEEAATVARGRR